MKTDHPIRRSSARQAVQAGCFALVFLAAALFPGVLPAAEENPSECSVLVVMSYHDGYPWQDDIHTGIEHVLRNTCRVTFFNLDSKRFPEASRQRAAEAFALFTKMRPAGVIATDDPAQDLFVVPYLKDKTTTPVAFCGVNAKPEKYGYPASNVTGILERYHGKETMSLLRQLVPEAKNFIFLSRGNDITAKEIGREIREESGSYPLRSLGIHMASTIEDAESLLTTVRATTDVLYLEHLEGIPDKNGRKLSHKEAYKRLLRIWGEKPTVCANEYSVRFGCLLTVQKSGFEQGATAGKMLLNTIGGPPIAEIPVVRNHTGVKIINVLVMKELRITPALSVFREAKLVRTEE
jgi:ABC-type uncharacterized transport system substrate-binding protein